MLDIIEFIFTTILNLGQYLYESLLNIPKYWGAWLFGMGVGGLYKVITKTIEYKGEILYFREDYSKSLDKRRTREQVDEAIPSTTRNIENKNPMPSRFNFDRGWRRIESILIILAVFFTLLTILSVVFLFHESQDIDDRLLFLLLVTPLYYLPIFFAKLIKWIIDGFRSNS